MRSEAKELQEYVRRFVIAPMVLALVPVTGAFRASAFQERQPAPPPFREPARPNSINVLPSAGEEYYIGPGDVIDIQIDKAPELSGTFRVGANGAFEMRYLGRIVAQQKTPEELGRYIANGLRGRYLKDPSVVVEVKQFNSHSFFIQGAVRIPGVYQIEGRPSLLKLITLAGGLTDNHGATAFIIREVKSKAPAENSHLANGSAPAASTPAKDESVVTAGFPDSTDRVDAKSQGEEGSKYRLLTVNISGLLKGNFEQDMVMEAGDIVNIPPTDVFFVAGEVRAPGSFPLKEGTTLRQAVSLAQGLTFEAAKDRGIIFREDQASGKRQEIRVQIGAVMNGRKDDVPIKANDVIIVENSRLKSVGGTLLRAFGVSAARLPSRY